MGNSNTWICNLYGLHSSTIGELMHKYGLERAYKRLPVEMEIVQLGNGVTLEQVYGNILSHGMPCTVSNHSVVALKPGENIVKALVFAEEYTYDLDSTDIDRARLGFPRHRHYRKVNIRQPLTLNTNSLEGMFSHFPIDELNIKQLNIPNVENIDRMFKGMSGTRVNVTFGQVENLKSANRLFASANIDEVNIHGLEVNNIKYMTACFREVRVGNINKLINSIGFNSVEDLAEAFSYIRDVDKLYIKKPEAVNIKDLSCAFFESQIDSLSIEFGEIKQLENMSTAFGHLDCTELNIVNTDIINRLPAGDSMKLGLGIFNKCSIAKLHLINGFKQFFKGVNIHLLESGTIGNKEELINNIQDNEEVDETFNIEIVEQGEYRNPEYRNIDYELMLHIKDLVQESNNQIEIEFIGGKVDIDQLSNNAHALGLNTHTIDKAVIIILRDNVLQVIAKGFNYIMDRTRTESIFCTLDLNKIKFSNVNLGNSLDRLFYGVIAEEIDISGLDLSTVRTAESMFKDCVLNKLVFGSNTTANIENFSGMFSNAEIKEMDTDCLDFSNVKNLCETFEGFIGPKLENLELDISQVSYLNWAFANTEIGRIKFTIPYVSKCKVIDRLFSNSTVDEIDITEINGAMLHNVENMFENADIGKLSIGTIGFRDIDKQFKMFRGMSTVPRELNVPKRIEYFIKAITEPMNTFESDNLKG